MGTCIAEFLRPQGIMRIESLPDGRNRISLTPAPGCTVQRRAWTTSYPLALIRAIHSTKGLYVCDEIMREEDPRYVEHFLRHAVLSYLDPAAFAGKRVLDFGCGSGASVMVLSRLLPPCEIVGIELDARLLEIARLRAEYFGRTSVRFLQSPSGDQLPPELGEFDFIMFNAVFEHLLPHERRQLLPLVWKHLRPGGVLFLNQTPYRYSPIEVHTTGGLPFINYLPDRLALRFARRFCKRVAPDETWTTLLRRGIRGATVPEVISCLNDPGHIALLRPLPRVGDRIDLWFKSLSKKHLGVKRGIWASLKVIKLLTRKELTPTLSLAFRKTA
ncbi:MAG TPA: class I SAM-dependent methyltransferase [Steroidobacteraceae bacterium]|nr:class I SAM-dependent methyltransferase [Steroidobacteraceae bacterium]